MVSVNVNRVRLRQSKVRKIQLEGRERVGFFFIASEKCSGTGLNFANFVVFGIACVDVSSRFSGTLRKYLFSF